jgi:hypothetical protein
MGTTGRWRKSYCEQAPVPRVRRAVSAICTLGNIEVGIPGSIKTIEQKARRYDGLFVICDLRVGRVTPTDGAGVVSG